MVGLWTPDPPPEPEGLEGSMVGYVMVVTASDSEDDEGYEGYEPLSEADGGESESPSADSDQDQESEQQPPGDGDSSERQRHTDSDARDRLRSCESKPTHVDFHKNVPLPSDHLDGGASCSFSGSSQSTSEGSNSRLDMGEQQVADVIAAMANVTLPPSAVPQWASVVPEEQWLQHILDRVKKLQDEKSNEK